MNTHTMNAMVERVKKMNDAADPESYRNHLEMLLLSIVDDCHESAAECASNWSDKSAGESWTIIAKRVAKWKV